MKLNYIPLTTLLIALVLISGCIQQTTTPSRTEQEQIKLQELKSQAQSLDHLSTSYTNILNDLNSGASAQSNTLALTYYRSVLEKTKTLNDKTLESYIDAIVSKLEQGQGATQEVLTTLVYMGQKIESGCDSLSNKISQDKYPEKIVNSNTAYITKSQKLTAILTDVNNVISAQSSTLKSSYANSALIKSREFGDSDMINIIDGLVNKLENNEDYTIDSMALYIYALNLELTECQNVIDTIISS